MTVGRKTFDHTGLRYGKLIAIRRSEIKKKKMVLWVCICDCGNTKVIRSDHLVSKGTTSCGCGRGKNQILRNPDRDGAANLRLWQRYQLSARKRGKEFTITYDEFASIIKADCFYCGERPSNIVRLNFKTTDTSMLYNGIDRMDNKKGYTADNCVPCCKSCNMMKKTLSYDDFVSLCTKIAQRHNKINV